MRGIVFVLVCSEFCTARLYVGGFPTKDGACYCFERVEATTPPAVEITLKIQKEEAKGE